MSTIAVIPARGGSKRIPKKNIKEFFGKPIIAYAIETALNSNLFEEVFVSTDSEEIAAIARQYGASVPVLRSPGNSGDFATTADVLLEVISYYGQKNALPKNMCCIYPASVLINSGDLLNAGNLFIDSGAPVMISCVAYSYPVQRSFTIQQDKIQMSYPGYMNTRSQDLEKVYHDAGSFYFFCVNDFLSEKTLWQQNSIPFILSEMKVQDIDTPEDWKLAELKYKMNLNEKL